LAAAEEVSGSGGYDATATGRRGRSTGGARGDGGDALVRSRGKEEERWARI